MRLKMLKDPIITIHYTFKTCDGNSRKTWQVINEVTSRNVSMVEGK